MGTFYEIVLKWMSQNTFNDKVNIGSGNGLVPSGKKPLPEPILTQIYVPYGIIRPQYVNSLWPNTYNPILGHETGAVLVQVMASRLFGALPLPTSMQTHGQLDCRNKFQGNLKGIQYIFLQENTFEKYVWKCHPFCFMLQCVTGDCTKPLPEPLLTNHQWDQVAFTLQWVWKLPV